MRENADVVFPERAYELLSSYVTHGSLAIPSQFDGEFNELMVLLTRPYRDARLYRVLKLSANDAAIASTVGLRLKPRHYSSWTKDRRSLERLIYDRSRPDLHVVVIEMLVRTTDIVVDVANFYREHRLTSHDFPEWTRYVRPEQEVIVREPWREGLIVTGDMMVELPVTDPAEATKSPKAGDRFVASDGTPDGVRSLAAAEDQPGNGVFRIVTTSGDPAYVRKNRSTGRWVEVER